MATIGLVRVENPLEFGIVITRDDGSIERFLEKPSWGQVFSDTINSGIFVLEPEIFDYIPAGPPGRLLLGGVPGAARRGRPGSSARWRRATGRTSARSRPTCGPTRTSSTAGSTSTCPGSRWATACTWGRAPRSTPRPRSSGPAVIGENCRIEAGVRLGPYTVLGTNVRVRANADLERVVVHDNSYLGEGVRLRGATIGRSCDLRGGVRGEEGVVLGDECFVGEHAVLAAGREGLPVQDGRGRGGHQLVDRVGVAGLPLAVRPGRRGRPGQRRHHPGAGRPGGHGLRHDPQEGRHGHHLPRFEPLGPDAEAGDDGRAQRLRGQRPRPRGGLGARHPLRGAAPRGGRAASPSGSWRATRSPA